MFPGSSILTKIVDCILASKSYTQRPKPGTVARRVMNAVAVHGKVPPGPVVVKLVVQDFAPDRRGMEGCDKDLRR